MRNLFLLLLLASSLSVAGQTNSTEVYEVADEMPYFSGCEAFSAGTVEKRNCSNKNLITYISDHLTYPEKARILGIEGTVYLTFIIDENGKIINPEIARDIGSGCGETALQILKIMPDWEPGTMKETPVKVRLNLPVKFSLKNTKFTSGPEIKIAWGKLIENNVDKKSIVENLENDIIIRDLAGDPLPITRLIFAKAKGDKITSAESSGMITPKMKKLVKKLKKGNEFAIVGTVQIDGELTDIERVFKIIE